MKVAYSFSVLRYVHDPLTQEFINIGVAVFSPAANYLRANCTTSYGRITHMFQKIEGQRFRQFSRYIQDQICAAGREYESALPFEASGTIEHVLAKILPPDDSAIQFSKAGVGLSSDLDRTLKDLFHRYVEQYTESGESPRRSDDDIWRVFRESLDRVLVTPRLRPKRIVAPNFDYEFERAWKNQRWHVYEPLSFDLLEASSMLTKANRWLGQATSLMESSEPFKIHFMLGEPQDERLKRAFTKAENILNMIQVPKEFIRESEADAFAEELARDIQGHSEEESGD